MNVVKDTLTGIIAELRDRKLWPLAAVLLIGVVAVPVLLSKKPNAAPTARTSTGGVAASSSAPLPNVSLGTAPSRSHLAGSSRDPFTQQLKSAVSSTAGTAVVTSGSGISPAGGSSAAAAGLGGSSVDQGGATASTGSSSGTVSSGNTSSPTPSAGSSTTTTTYYVDAVDLTFGAVGQRARTYRDVARLSPFPSARNPLIVYLGLKNDRQTAVFLVSSAVTPYGLGTCVPSPTNCDFLDLKVGQPEALLVVDTLNNVAQYQFEVSAIHLHQVTSVTQARRAYARVSNAGARLVNQARRQLRALDALSYSGDTGLLSVNTPKLRQLGLLP